MNGRRKTRVDFNAPRSLVERADSVVEILDISRTRLLIDALEDELEEQQPTRSFDGDSVTPTTTVASATIPLKPSLVVRKHSE